MDSINLQKHHALTSSVNVKELFNPLLERLSGKGIVANETIFMSQLKTGYGFLFEHQLIFSGSKITVI